MSHHHVEMERIYVYKGFERFWHWMQAFLIFALTVTGFEVHGWYTLCGFENAVHMHNALALAFGVLVAFAIFWHFTTGEWKQYIPTTKNLMSQVLFYLYGIFRGDAHPTTKTLRHKFNPLQRFSYLGLKLFVIPVQGLTGVLYYYYNDWGWIDQNLGIATQGWSLGFIAIAHLIGAFGLVSFVIIHVYLTTTGHTITANLKAMITGWEDLEKSDETGNN